jgi:hypothetical protein
MGNKKLRGTFSRLTTTTAGMLYATRMPSRSNPFTLRFKVFSNSANLALSQFYRAGQNRSGHRGKRDLREDWIFWGALSDRGESDLRL